LEDDPYGEHDWASFELNGEHFVWTIDYFDETCTYRSKDPCDPDITTRVLTLMLGETIKLRPRSSFCSRQSDTKSNSFLLLKISLVGFVETQQKIG
jgi:Protein of unknown function (DUF3768)